MPRSLLFTLLTLLISAAAFSDAGMWTFHDFPHELLKREHGANVDQAWLDRVRTSTIRLANCTASFVSPNGLILTNHHCAAACLDEHSTSERNLLRDGFVAHSREEEPKCGAQVADVLMDMENVSAKVAAAIKGRTTSSSRAGTSICRCCALTGRMASPPRHRISSGSAPPDPMPASWCSSPGIPATPTGC